MNYLKYSLVLALLSVNLLAETDLKYFVDGGTSTRKIYVVPNNNVVVQPVPTCSRVVVVSTCYGSSFETFSALSCYIDGNVKENQIVEWVSVNREENLVQRINTPAIYQAKDIYNQGCYMGGAGHNYIPLYKEKNNQAALCAVRSNCLKLASMWLKIESLNNGMSSVALEGARVSSMHAVNNPCERPLSSDEVTLLANPVLASARQLYISKNAVAAAPARSK